MKIPETSIPVLVLNCKLGALGIMRSLGSLGVTLHGVDAYPKSPGMLSKYCQKKFYMDLEPDKSEEYLDFVLKIGEGLNQKTVLIPTSDETAVFVAEYYSELSKYFLTPQNGVALFRNLMSKKGMYHMALEHGIPTPQTEFPQNLQEVENYLKEVKYPVMLKAIDGGKLYARCKVKMVIVHNEKELLKQYKLLEDPESPNLMLQELIPGNDDQVYIFNGYFNESSDCLTAFTGNKVRQYPIHVGCASLGECKWYQEVAELTTSFMKKIGFRGILDIGYRLDPRDGKYKVLDINPRIGQAFRLFIGENNIDVARALYLDLTKQNVLSDTPKEGRRWLIEDFDIVSAYDYYKEGTLGFVEWATSFKNVEEGAWFSLKDPYPFFQMASNMVKKKIKSFVNKRMN